MKNSDLPAAPILNQNGSPHFSGDLPLSERVCSGLTKREMFAMEAMKAAISNKAVFEYADISNDEFKVEIKRFSYEMADIMLEEK